MLQQGEMSPATPAGINDVLLVPDRVFAPGMRSTEFWVASPLYLSKIIAGFMTTRLHFPNHWLRRCLLRAEQVSRPPGAPVGARSVSFGAPAAPKQVVE